MVKTCHANHNILTTNPVLFSVYINTPATPSCTMKASEAPNYNSQYQIYNVRFIRVFLPFYVTKMYVLLECFVKHKLYVLLEYFALHS